MRDGTKLFTAVYTPKDKIAQLPVHAEPHLLQLQSVRGRELPGTNRALEGDGREGYIFVRQDVRGRWMSEGKFDNMRPHVAGNESIDESSDTWDTVEWLVKNIPNNNGKSECGHLLSGILFSRCLAGAPSGARCGFAPSPIADFFFDDFHHQGAYLLSYFMATPTFGYQHAGPTKQKLVSGSLPLFPRCLQFYMDLGPLKNADKYFGQDNFFWQEIVSHPNYDEFWQKRSILPHLKNVTANVLVVGGLFDAEDLYGP